MATTIQQIELPKKARAVDTSGNNNHGQIYSGRGLEFDGVTDYIHTPLDGNPGSFGNQSDFETTIAFWVKVNTHTGGAGLMQWASTGQVADSTPFVLLALNTTAGTSRLYVDGDYRNLTHPLQVDTWYRLVITRTASDNTWRVYVNGVADVTHDDSGTPNAQDSAVSFYLGTGYNKYFSGAFSNAQVWNKAFTQADVTYDYLNPESLALNGSGTALTESNLKLWYPMQDGHRGQQSYILDGANSGLGVELANFADGNIAFNNSGASVASSNSLNSYNAVGDGSTGDSRPRVSFALTTGQTYKIEYTPTLVLDGGVLDFFVGGSRLISNNDINTSFTKTFTSASGHEGFDFDGSQAFNVDFTLSIKAINDKHHATTVFYGDEMIADAKNRTGFASSDWAAHNIASGNVTVVSSKLQVVTETDSAPEGVKLGTTKFTDLVAGRTYRVSVDLQQTSGATTPTMRIELGSTQTADFNISASSVTYTKDIIATDDDNLIIYNKSNTSSTTFTVDNVSIKEIGVASGWTDADQQLHIPQTALQSYNELAWGNSASANYVTATPDPNFGKADFSISYAFYADDADGSEKVFAMNTPLVVRRIEGNKLKIYASDGTANTGYTAVTPASAIKNGRWHHVIENWNYTSGDWDNLSIYLDGVKMSESSDLSSLDGDVDFNYTGDHHFGKYDSNTSLTGVITEIAYWKGINFTDAEAIELYNDGKVLDAKLHSRSDASILLNYWRNNGLSQWKDLVGTDHSTANTFTETILIPQGVDSTRDAQGFIMNKQKDTSSLNLTNGSDSPHVDLGSITTIADDEAFSFVVWLKPDDLAANNFIGRGSSLDWARIHDSNTIKFRADNTTVVFSTSTLVAKEWVHVAIVRKASNDLVSVYINGAAGVDTETLNEPFDYRYLGSGDTANDNFRGAIDGFLIYEDELSAAEVLRNYNATKGNHRN